MLWDGLTASFPLQLWTRRLAGGDVAVGCYNKGAVDPEHPASATPADGPAADITFTFEEVGPACGYTRAHCH